MKAEMLSKSNRIERIHYISDRLSERFSTVIIHDEVFHILPNGVVFTITALGGEYDALVIEFAENAEEARKYNSDDGELYFMVDYGPEEMFDEMMKEIENEM